MVGLRAEAVIAQRLDVPVFVGGGTAAGAEMAARRAVDSGATALISFGLAGGLDPALDPGALIVPRTVICDGATFTTDDELMDVLGGATGHALLATETIAANAVTKRMLWQETGAAALDVESSAVARIASVCSVPFAVLRAICDPAGRDLPPAALIALDQGGSIRLARIAASVFAQPGQIPALLRLTADASAARRALLYRVSNIRL